MINKKLLIFLGLFLFSCNYRAQANDNVSQRANDSIHFFKAISAAEIVSNDVYACSEHPCPHGTTKPNKIGSVSDRGKSINYESYIDSRKYCVIQSIDRVFFENSISVLWACGSFLSVKFNDSFKENDNNLIDIESNIAVISLKI